MISVSRVIKPALQQSYSARNGGSGRFHAFIGGNGATGDRYKTSLEASWLVAKGGSGRNLGELWDSYLTSKGFTTGPLKDRMKAFFISGVQA